MEIPDFPLTDDDQVQFNRAMIRLSNDDFMSMLKEMADIFEKETPGHCIDVLLREAAYRLGDD